ncbi:MAG TPA: hypothetical protein PK364_08570 [Synergistaceae bacterium]|nr:hypothetical protein [Synergistaceae bacterium]HPJ24858.1 hypothetical protein [Synergistaceae bacterium]HPQ36451.1 hypothetical protein [Synergistaceae bacterium]
MDDLKAMRSVIQKKWKCQEDSRGERQATVRLPMNVYLRIAAYAADRKKTVSEALAEIATFYLDGKEDFSGFLGKK